MKDIPSLIGYSLSRAKSFLSEDVAFIIDETITPFEDKKEERKNNEAIIVRQIVKNNILYLTITYFK